MDAGRLADVAQTANGKAAANETLRWIDDRAAIIGRARTRRVARRKPARLKCQHPRVHRSRVSGSKAMAWTTFAQEHAPHLDANPLCAPALPGTLRKLAAHRPPRPMSAARGEVRPGLHGPELPAFSPSKPRVVSWPSQAENEDADASCKRRKFPVSIAVRPVIRRPSHTSVPAFPRMSDKTRRNGSGPVSRSRGKAAGLPHEACAIGDAGWSSPVARQAHNLKVVGSNPTPATKILS